jgi:DNA polymerase-3 subunit delta'
MKKHPISTSLKNGAPYPWQASQWEYLEHAFRQNTLPHALIFKGQIGLGKADLADYFARYLLCEAAHNQPCGACRSCALSTSKLHPNWFIVTPEDNGAIKIDVIRALIPFIHETGHHRGRRVITMAKAHSMNSAAANALLKMLEEPADDVIFIMVSALPGQLPVTVRSRCVQLQFTAPSRKEALVWMSQSAAIDHSQAANALAHTGNAPLGALHWLHGNVNDLRKKVYMDLFAVQCSEMDVLTVAQSWLEIPIEQLLVLWSDLMRDFIHIRLSGESQKIKNQDFCPILEELTTVIPIIQAWRFYDELQQALYFTLKKINLNARLSLESLLVGWSQLIPKKERVQE